MGRSLGAKAGVQMRVGLSSWFEAEEVKLIAANRPREASARNGGGDRFCGGHHVWNTAETVNTLWSSSGCREQVWSRR